MANVSDGKTCCTASQDELEIALMVSGSRVILTANDDHVLKYLKAKLEFLVFREGSWSDF